MEAPSASIASAVLVAISMLGAVFWVFGPGLELVVVAYVAVVLVGRFREAAGLQATPRRLLLPNATRTMALLLGFGITGALLVGGTLPLT